ncbi:ABC transporter permease [Oceanirhabdus seepicola]|uniref:ABC transporter permease n=1 Tax=Oceanirhabdus seepicola TaxID=2828781 RepID=A0A9J6P2K1_9CLOT|nr:ABC transporter permease [Oceanirhabdus seepicola]MCM1989744.1 ABC transporter permease [Oceanirhabdus seepicola]
MDTKLLSKEKKLVNKEKFKTVGCDFKYSNNVTIEALGYNKRAWLKFKNNKIALISLFLLTIILSISFTSPIWAADQIYTIEDAKGLSYLGEGNIDVNFKILKSRELLKKNFGLPNASPSSQHIFGTDRHGVDIFANTFVRLRLSLYLGIVVALLNTFIGIIYGTISGYMGGIIDDIMMRVIEVISSIPNILLISIIVIVIGNSFKSILIAMALLGWCKTAMIVRGKVCQLREQEFIIASKALGADRERIVIAHMIPNIMPLAMTAFSDDIPSVILDEAMLSCIGLGIRVPYYTLGKMLFSYSDSSVLFFYSYQIILPSLVLALVILLFQYVATALTDAFDPNIIY